MSLICGTGNIPCKFVSGIPNNGELELERRMLVLYFVMPMRIVLKDQYFRLGPAKIALCLLI